MLPVAYLRLRAIKNLLAFRELEITFPPCNSPKLMILFAIDSHESRPISFSGRCSS